MDVLNNKGLLNFLRTLRLKSCVSYVPRISMRGVFF